MCIRTVVDLEISRGDFRLSITVRADPEFPKREFLQFQPSFKLKTENNNKKVPAVE